jgi:hypothetical protein
LDQEGTKVNEVKKLLRLRTLLALASLALVVVLLTAVQGIGQNGGENQQPPTPKEKAKAAAAVAAAPQHVRPAKVFYAVVDPDGTLARGKGAIMAQSLGDGAYEVLFYRGVRNCAYVATIGISGSNGQSEPGEITVAGRFNNKRGVFVQTHDSTGAFADRGFHLQVSC